MPIDREELTRRLMVTFLEELEEHTATLNQGLLSLEASAGEVPDPEVVTTLFRTAHSLKGASRSVGVIPVEQACHQLEEILAGVRDGEMTLGGDAYRVLFAAIDGISDVGRRLRHAETLVEAPLRTLVSKLEEVRDAAARNPPSREARAAAVARASGPWASEPREARIGPPSEAREAPSSPRVPAPPEDVVVRAVHSTVPPAPAPDPTSSRRLEGSGMVRVSADKLDGLLAQSGELLATRSRVENRVRGLESVRELLESSRADLKIVRKPLKNANGGSSRAYSAFERASESLSRAERELDRFSAAVTNDVRALSLVATRLDEEVRRARMVPFAEACEGMGRMVRDLCAARDKLADVVVVGGELEIDRFIAQRLKDPLTHLVRNAVDHGLETASRRARAGKPAKGKISVSAVIRGPFIEVSVEDDGAGVDASSVSLRARERGLQEPTHERDVSRLIFLHGFSTAKRVTEVSGRGVGLDAVKATVESLHGSVEFTSEPGRGTRFAMRVPLTLTTLRVLVLRAGNQEFAVATASVARVLTATRDARIQVQGRSMLRTDAGPIPFVSMSSVLGLSDVAVESERANVVVLRSGETAAFAVDELVAEYEVVVKALGARLRRVKNVSGAAVLPNGRLALILSPAELVRSASLATSPGRLPLKDAARKLQLLVVDDTVTTRTLVKSILEGAGYLVTTASDGVEALSLLTSRPFDLVVSDVEMPRMDGFTLTRSIRQSDDISELPVILVTGLSSEVHRKSGLEAGANAYLVKTAFDQQNLLETIRELV